MIYLNLEASNYLVTLSQQQKKLYSIQVNQQISQAPNRIQMEENQDYEGSSFASLTIQFVGITDDQSLLGAIFAVSDNIALMGFKVIKHRTFKPKPPQIKEDQMNINPPLVKEQQQQVINKDKDKQLKNEKIDYSQDAQIIKEEKKLNDEIKQLGIVKQQSSFNYQCSQCKRCYENEQKLKRHIKQKHENLEQNSCFEQSKVKNPDNPFPCILCDMVNYSKYMLIKHYALDHSSRDFFERQYERSKFITKLEILQFKNAEKQRVEKAIQREMQEEEENEFKMFMKRFSRYRKEQESFPLQASKFKIIYQLFRKAEPINLEEIGEASNPFQIKRDNNSLYVYPLNYFKKDRYSQVQVNSVFNLLKISYFLDSNHVMKLGSVKRGTNFIAFQVDDPEECLETLLYSYDFPPRDRLKIAKAILSGIKNIHEAGYIHGDIKPANILINKDLSRIEISCISNPKYLEETICDQSQVSSYYTPKITSDISRGDKIWDYYAFGAICFRLLVGEKIHLNSDAQSAAVDPFTLPILKRMISKKGEHMLLKMCLINNKNIDEQFEDRVQELLDECTFEPATLVEALGWEQRIKACQTEAYERDFKIKQVQA